MRGQSVLEYGLIVATIAIVTLLGVNAFGRMLAAWFHAILQRLTGAP